ncbi:MAG: hypothetical protein KDI15_00400 [Thiothrix sp.]|nr:hypothetical protein [Thiothrix sp.]HPE62334.1 hypothetical protein [Thiolinea sp.]
MSTPLGNMSWLDPVRFKSAASRRFIEFCRQDLAAADPRPDKEALQLYREAALLVLERLETLSNRRDRS